MAFHELQLAEEGDNHWTFRTAGGKVLAQYWPSLQKLTCGRKTKQNVSPEQAVEAAIRQARAD